MTIADLACRATCPPPSPSTPFDYTWCKQWPLIGTPEFHPENCGPDPDVLVRQGCSIDSGPGAFPGPITSLNGGFRRTARCYAHTPQGMVDIGASWADYEVICRHKPRFGGVFFGPTAYAYHAAVECANAWLAVSNFVLSLVIGSFAGYIAWRQYRTAHNKLKFDMFEKRLVVYETAINYLTCVVNRNKILDSDSLEFLRATQSARWLFDQEFETYLKKVILDETDELDAITTVLSDELDPDKRKELVAKQRAQKEFLREQIDELEKRAAKFLQLKSD